MWRLTRPPDCYVVRETPVAIGGFFGIGLAMEVIHALAAIHEESDTEAASFGKPREEWCRAIHL